MALCALVPEVAHLMVGGEAEGFATDAVRARNLRVHIDAGGVRHSTDRLIVLGARLGTILEAVMLHVEFGSDTADVAERVARASRLRRLAIAAGRASDTLRT